MKTREGDGKTFEKDGELFIVGLDEVEEEVRAAG